MGIFKKKRIPVERIIAFDSDWFDSWESLRLEQEKNPFPVDTKVTFDESLLMEIWSSIENHEPTSRVPYDEEQQPINNVGESYRQEQISLFCEGRPGGEMDWLAGFLLPEMANAYDKNAVAIYVIKPVASKDELANSFSILHGGYMDKESAKKVHKKILNLMGKNQFIPLLIRIQGGSQDKPNYGVFAYAKTKVLKFP